MVKKLALIAALCTPFAFGANTCQITIKNTSPSTIYISNNPALSETPELEELEQAGSIALAPREDNAIALCSYFAIYTRAPKSNYQYQRHFTIALRDCQDGEDAEIFIELEDLEHNRTSHERLIIINHQHEHAVPEAAYPLCPYGAQAKKQAKSGQYMCTVTEYDETLGQEIAKQIPVVHYIYQYLPSWVYAQWYTQNPALYHWYEKNSEYRHTAPEYQAPWQTEWYAQWYQSQPKTAVEFLEKPA